MQNRSTHLHKRVRRTSRLNRTLWLACALFACQNFLRAGDLEVTVTGIVSETALFSGPYSGAQVGDVVSIRFEVYLPGNAVVPDENVEYGLDLDSFHIAIGGAVPGKPVGPAVLSVSNGYPNSDGVHFSRNLDNGEFLAFEFEAADDFFAAATLLDITGDYDVGLEAQLAYMQITGSAGFLRMDFDTLRIGRPPHSIRYCEGKTNSTGSTCDLLPVWIPRNGSEIHFDASGGPPGQFAYLLISTGAETPGSTLGQGTLCLGVNAPSMIGRYNAIGTNRNSVGSFSATGVWENGVGTSNSGLGFDVPLELPLAGNPSIHAGQTFYFQLWYRDIGGQSNLSSAIAVQF